MAELRIRVGASVDASVEAVFPRIEKAASRARKSVEKDFAQAVPKAMKSGADKAEAEFAKLAAEVEGKGSKMMTPATRAITEFASESQKRFKQTQSEFQAMTRVMDRELRKQQDAQARAALGMGGPAASAKRGPSMWSSRVPIGLGIGFASRMVGDLARGAGVQTDIGALVGNFVSRQALSQDIANSGYQPGAKGAAGKLQDAGAIQAEAMNVAKATATDPTKALEGLQKFVAVTGDLETGRAILGDMAKLSNATGSNLEDVVTAAGDVSAKLGEVPHKAEAINAIMRQIAGQGKLGAVEMRDFAKQLASIAALAPQFSGGIEKNIGEMAILLQEGRQLGGAKNAAQAATGVRAFASTFTKGARIKEFAARGVKLRNEDGGLRGAQEIIMDSLKATHGNADALYGKLFSSEQSKVAVRGFETIYNHTEGDQATKLKAVSDEFDRLRKATMSQADVDEANARKMQTTQAMVQELNNSFQQVADETSAKLLPSLKEMAPGLIIAAGGVATALAALTPVIVLVAKSLGMLLGAGPETVTHDTSGVTGDILTLNNLTGGAGPMGGRRMSSKDLKHFQDARNNMAEQVTQDERQADDAKAKFERSHMGSLGLTVSQLRGTEDDYIAKEAQGGDKGAQAVLAAKEKTRADREQADQMEEALRRAFKEMSQGVLKVEIVGGKGPVTADQSGRMPVDGKKK